MRIGRFIIKSVFNRGDKDNTVLCNFPSGVKLLIVVERLLLINVTIGETFDLQVPFIQVKPFREHPCRKWLGKTQFSKFVLLNFETKSFFSFTWLFESVQF